MLAASRRLVWQHENVVAGRWRGNDFSANLVFELEDKVLGIVGLGNIGKKVARLANAFHMRVQSYDIARLSGDAEDALGVRFALFPELLQSSDIVTLHVPLDGQTHKMIGERELAMMKPTAILINTCRGPVVDEDALYDPLTTDRNPGACVEVSPAAPQGPASCAVRWAGRSRGLVDDPAAWRYPLRDGRLLEMGPSVPLSRREILSAGALAARDACGPQTGIAEGMG